MCGNKSAAPSKARILSTDDFLCGKASLERKGKPGVRALTDICVILNREVKLKIFQNLIYNIFPFTLCKQDYLAHGILYLLKG